MIRVGLTGGIGSGKSTIARIFEVLGIPVYYADPEAQQLMHNDPDLKAAIIRHFGPDSYSGDTLHRAYLSQLIFSQPEKRELLNGLVHPAVKKHAEEWMRRQSTPYAIHEAALIFEAGVTDRLDLVIGVYAPESLRLLRATRRDNSSIEEIKKRMKGQIEEEIKMKLCDHVIVNDEQQAVIPQVLALHQLLLEKSGTHG
ncbi:MAG: dephospho-CoA kinase [Chitinophagaceae bacterium]|nr:dephospho-CoA kinase [Chitinophagaceae bacterium]